MPKNQKEYSIFIVEDSDLYRDLLVKFLSGMEKKIEYNYNLHAFASGEECLAHLHLAPDIVVIDYYLSEANPAAIDGLTLLKELKSRLPKAEVVVLSRQEDVMITAQLFRQGASDYIPKEPAGRARLQNVLVRLISDIEKRKGTNRKLYTYAFLIFLLGLLIGGFLF